MSYATLTQLKSALKITDTSQDTYLTDILARVTDWIDLYTNRTWQGPVTVVDEEYDLPTNTDGVIFLRRMDITSLDTLKIGTPFGNSYQTLTSGSDYVWNKTGRIIIPNFTQGQITSLFGGSVFNLGPVSSYGAILASYKYGATAPSKTVEMAAIDIAQNLYTNLASQGVKSEKIGDYQIQYQDADLMRAAGDSMGALNHLRLRRI